MEAAGAPVPPGPEAGARGGSEPGARADFHAAPGASVPRDMPGASADSGPAAAPPPPPARRPRVLFVGPLPPPMGGGQLLLDMLLHSSLALDFEIHVVDTSKRALRWAVEKPSWRTPFFFARDLGRLVPALLSIQPEVVVVHAAGSLSFVRDWLFMLAARVCGARVVCHYHGTLHTRFPSTLTPAGRFFGRAMMSAADRVIVVGPGYRERFAAAWRRDDVAWSPNVADVPLYRAAAGERGPWLAPGERGVLFVGRLSKPKGIWDLIDAMPAVIARHPEARFLLCGVAENEAQEPVLRAAVAERGLTERVRFLGSLDGGEKALAYASASVFVSPSWTEAFPLVVPEAMASGLPMVLTAVGAIPDLVRDGEDGFLVPPRDPAMLADRINRLLDDEPLRGRIAAHVRERAPREFDIEVGATHVRDVIDGVLDHPRVHRVETGPAPGTPRWPAEKGLLFWLVILTVFGLGGVLFGEQELALMVAMAGLFVTAQAADLEPRWATLYRALSWVVPLASAAAFAALAVLIFQGDLAIGPKSILLGFTCASSLACLATGARPVADGLSRMLLRANPPSHILRLSARLILAGLLLAIPGWFALRDVLTDESQNLMEQLSLGTGLIGYVLLALAAVGFMVRRDLRATLDRLGLKALTLKHGGTIVFGVVGLLLLNQGADSLQKLVFPALWQRDQDFNQALAGGLSGAQAVMLGMSAGIGEEITMRGALQPRLGLVLTSMLFASLHIQYSWYGMAVIFVLGLVLGVIRKRTSTTAAMAVHVLYDIVAVLTT